MSIHEAIDQLAEDARTVARGHGKPEGDKMIYDDGKMIIKAEADPAGRHVSISVYASATGEVNEVLNYDYELEHPWFEIREGKGDYGIWEGSGSWIEYAEQELSKLKDSPS